MNIKFKLTLWFNSIVAAILFGSFYFVHQNYTHFRQSNFFERLNDRAHFIANTFIETGGLSQQTIETLIGYNLSVSSNLHLSIYDSVGTLLQPIGLTIPISNERFKQINTELYIEEQKTDTQYVYFTLAHAKGNLIVVAGAIDKTGFKKVEFLGNLFLIIWLASIVTTAFAGWWFSRLALKPMNQVVNDVQRITAKNLHNRLTVHKSRDEIADLAHTFNKMLDRLEASFALQKDFVSNASHEFRTPLTSIKGQIQVALLRARSEKDYQHLLQSLNDDINNIINLLNALQELAKANADFPFKTFYPIQILDILLDVQNELLKNKPTYQIEINIADLEDENINTYCFGDVNLLKSAFNNIIDNGCKFSPSKKVSLTLQFQTKHISFLFKDDGVGISEENLQHIFEPFYRGNDTRNIYGHGIGLSLVKRIIELHNGTIKVTSVLGKGTAFLVTLPNYENKE
jgi:signal transduction histidine kinase